MKKTTLFDIVNRNDASGIGKGALEVNRVGATHSVSAEGALPRAFSPAIVHARVRECPAAVVASPAVE